MEEDLKSQRNLLSQGMVPEELANLQHSFMQLLLRVVLLVIPFALGLSSYASWRTGQIWIIPIYWLVYLLIFLFYFWKDGPFRLRVWCLLSVLYVEAIINFLKDGTTGGARLFLIIIPFLARLFLSRGEGVVSVVLCMLIEGVFGAFFASGVMQAPGYSVAFDFRHWLTGSLILLILDVLLVLGVDYFVGNFGVIMNRSQALADDLESQHAQLENLVAERTATLERRAQYLEATAKVARGASISLDDPETLYMHLVNLIAEQFGFYNVALFLLTSDGEWVELRAASSEAGKRLLDQGHRLRVGLQGVVGYAADRGEVRVVADVREDVLYQTLVTLPSTRSEAALPLRVAGTIIGVLDVQDTEPQALTEEDVAVLQSLADEVAVAVSNVRLFQQLQESVQAERRARGELSFESWQDQLHVYGNSGFMKQNESVTQAQDFWRPEMTSALKSGRAAMSISDPRVLAVPIKVAGQVVAIIDAELPDDLRKWTPEQVSLLESLSDELGEALERARLYEETRRRATREQISREITTHVRESLDIQTILSTAVSEIGERLGVETEVWMGMDLTTDEPAGT